MVNTTDISPRARAALERLTKKSGRSYNITSGYRSPEYNKKVGGARNSQHIEGNAYDISTAGMSEAEVQQLVQYAIDSGFTGVGVYGNSVHFDTGPKRYWGPSRTADEGQYDGPEWLPGMMGGAQGDGHYEGDGHDHGAQQAQQAQPAQPAAPPVPAYAKLKKNEQGLWVHDDGTEMNQGLTRVGNIGLNKQGLADAFGAFSQYAASRRA